MNNELLPQKSWWEKNKKWFFPTLVIITALFILYYQSGSNKHLTNYVQGYNETALYENALEKAQANERVKTVLGTLDPINKLSLVEGEIQYTNNNNSVSYTIKINGENGKGLMDVSADKIEDQWNYTSIKVRIKNPPENKETIVILE
ncbi:cytochrome c oxidase assembly factor Coa1 family protein [Joostella sp.]|uniref:cytochrome c oxidase assembly factor Coa1 family protein n=1 Tax=Joostella sp. TaxID=2231138 RepID=UPI003A908D7C